MLWQLEAFWEEMQCVDVHTLGRPWGGFWERPQMQSGQRQNVLWSTSTRGWCYAWGLNTLSLPHPPRVLRSHVPGTVASKVVLPACTYHLWLRMEQVRSYLRWGEGLLLIYYEKLHAYLYTPAQPLRPPRHSTTDGWDPAHQEGSAHAQWGSPMVMC